MVVEEFASRASIRLLHVPYKRIPKRNSEGVRALSEDIMAYADSTSWAPQVDAATSRLLITSGSKRTRRSPTLATLRELGYDIMTDSPYGIGDA